MRCKMMNKMNKYIELRKKHESEIDSFPFGFAFNKNQFAEMMKKWGYSINDKDKICKIGGGGYVRVADINQMNDMFNRHEKERQDALHDEHYLYDMFTYGLDEYLYYSFDDVPYVLDSLNLNLETVNSNPLIYDVLNKVILQNALVKHYVDSKGLITGQDVGDTLLQQWTTHIDTLYKYALEFNRLIDDDPNTLNEYMSDNVLWNTIRLMYEDMIGLVNNYKLPKSTEMSWLIGVYASQARKSESCGKQSSRDFFRLKVENFLAREIITQHNKSPRMLEDENLDLKAIRNKKAKARKRKRETYQQNNTENEIDENRKCFDDEILYIYKGNIRCRQYTHEIVQATAVLHNRTDNEIELNVEYCTECKKYILEYTLFEQYRNRYGVLVGNFRMVVNGEFDGEYDLAEESPLMLSGYNVSQRDGYTSQERHYILARIIHDGIMDKGDVIRYLSYFIRKNGAKRGNELALSKWEEDLGFVQKYNKNTQPRAIIRDIKKY